MNNPYVGRILLFYGFLVLASSDLFSTGSGYQAIEPQAKTPVLEEYAGQVQEAIYGRKHGVALTMDIFTPDRPNGAGCILVVSGGWVSHRDRLNHPLFRGIIAAFFKRGYTVFAVLHGSQPKYTIPEILEDLHRAVRFIRFFADDYGVNPNRLGITGGSAGAHLSLMQGVAGRAGDPDAEDPVDQESSRVQAVGCFFPPTDFLNYGEPGEIALGRGLLKNYRAPFDFQEYDVESRSYVPITDLMRLLEIGREISPISHISNDDPPTLIFHGDADKLVPVQQSALFVKKLQETGVVARLEIREGRGHGWPQIGKDISMIVDWFDAHMGKK
jgi:acetyl esterase/lipase